MKWVQKKGARRRGKKKISKPRQTTTLTPPQKTFFLLSLLLEGTIAGVIVPISRECTFSPKPRRRECEGVRAKGRPRGSEGASKNRAIAAAAAESIIGHRSLVLLPDSGLLLHRDGMDLLRCLGNRGRMGDSLPWAARRAMKRRASHRRPTAAAAAGPQSTLQLFLPLVSALPRARWLRAFSCSTDAPSRVSSCPSCGFRTEIRDRAGGVWSDGRWHRRSNARRKREEQQRRWQLPDLSLSLHSTRNLLSLFTQLATSSLSLLPAPSPSKQVSPRALWSKENSQIFQLPIRLSRWATPTSGTRTTTTTPRGAARAASAATTGASCASTGSTCAGSASAPPRPRWGSSSTVRCGRKGRDP